jgi:hypothetical protein
MLLPHSAYGWLRQIKTRARYLVVARAESFDATKFAVEDFWVSEDGLHECINLIATSG